MAAKKPQEMQYYETLEGTTYLTYLFRDLKCTDEEASKRLGISRQTLHTWKNKSKIIFRPSIPETQKPRKHWEKREFRPLKIFLTTLLTLSI